MDVVIVGAGVAGLAALERARELGLEALALEAAGRIGGRALTDRRALGVPFDRGCHWLHCADRNPLTKLADAMGYVVDRAPPRIVSRLGDRWATAAEEAARADYFESCYAAVGATAADVSVAEVCDRTSPWWRLFASYSTAAAGVEPERSSTLDFNRYLETAEHWPVRDGFGALVAQWGRGLPVVLDAPVVRIEWGGPGVRVHHEGGVVEASAVVVTVSTAVLSGEAIRFEPRVDDALAAAADLPLGHAEKVAFELAPGFYAGTGIEASPPCYAIVDAPACVHFELRPFGAELAVAFLAGEEAGAITRAGPEAMIDFARGHLSALFGSATPERVLRATTTHWSLDRFVGGGYSAARPGRAVAREILAAPRDGRLYFAGEATSLEAYSTAHGAYQSGRAAIEAIAGGVRATAW